MDEVINHIMARDNSGPNDYVRDGVRFCGTCHQPKQFWCELPEVGKKLLPIACNCEKSAQEEEQGALELQRFKTWISDEQKKFNVTDYAYRNMTFEGDDRKEPKVSNACRKYVEQWEVMKEDNVGILFYGTVGTGKSFFACCIANALLERRVPIAVTNFPRLLNLLQGARDRQELIDHLQRYDLLVIDDLGVERDSSYAAEQVYNVIDARARSQLPMIVTTNLALEELENPGSMQYTRIYDRILELCPVRIRLTGESRRKGNAEARKAKTRELLLG